MKGPIVVKSLPMNKGVVLNIIRDESRPADSPDYWSATVESSGIGDPIVVPVHWHKTHTERITVREGRLEATLNGTTRIVFAGETLEVPPYATHGFKGFRGERLVVTETAYPAGDYKAAFFNDLLSEGWPAPFWHTMRAFYDGDGYPSLGLYFKIFDFMLIKVFGGIAKLILPPKPPIY